MILKKDTSEPSRFIIDGEGLLLVSAFSYSQEETPLLNVEGTHSIWSIMIPYCRNNHKTRACCLCMNPEIVACVAVVSCIFS